MKKFEKYKIAPQAKFLKFKVKHFVEIPRIRHDKAVPLPAWLPKIISLPWMCPHPDSWSLAVAPPAWLMTQKSFPLIPGGRTLCFLPLSSQETWWSLFMDGFQLYQGYRATARRQFFCHSVPNPSVPVAHLIDLTKMKGWVDLRAAQRFWNWDAWIGNLAPEPQGQFA